MSSIIIHTVRGSKTHIQYEDTDSIEYDYKVGEYNGCLSIIAKTAGNPDGVITVPDKEETVKTFSAQQWTQVRRED